LNLEEAELVSKGKGIKTMNLEEGFGEELEVI